MSRTAAIAFCCLWVSGAVPGAGAQTPAPADDRKSGNLVGSIGELGRMAGQFFWIDAIAIDSLGNIYTGEVHTGKRVQKFVLQNGNGVRRPRPHE